MLAIGQGEGRVFALGLAIYSRRKEKCWIDDGNKFAGAIRATIAQPHQRKECRGPKSSQPMLDPRSQPSAE
jgi:hypothetical protein